MDSMDQRLVDVFYDVQSGLARQGPGDDDSTLRAVRACTDLPTPCAVLDVGCGPGMQTMALARALDGHVTAVDNCEEYLQQLRRTVRDAALADRVDVRSGDMNKLDIAPASFDLIWCEGAAYIMGVREALTAWRPLLREGGYLAFTELVWLTDTPPNEVGEFFKKEYPAMTTVAGVRTTIAEIGYRLITDFTLPDAAWWDDYYGPLRSKLPGLREKYAGDDEALAIVAMTEREIDVRKRFHNHYGYQFYVAQRSE